MTDKFPGCALAKEWTKEKKAAVISQHFFPLDRAEQTGEDPMFLNAKRDALYWQVIHACNMELHKGMGEYGDDDDAKPREFPRKEQAGGK